jgi:membrane-bound lytic murein transglycosylase MltF
LSAVLGQKPTYDAPYTGDLDGLRKRGYIRVLVPYNRTFFFYDGLQPRGFAYELMTEFGSAAAKLILAPFLDTFCGSPPPSNGIAGAAK